MALLVRVAGRSRALSHGTLIDTDATIEVHDHSSISILCHLSSHVDSLVPSRTVEFWCNGIYNYRSSQGAIKTHK